MIDGMFQDGDKGEWVVVMQVGEFVVGAVSKVYPNRQMADRFALRCTMVENRKHVSYRVTIAL